MIAIRLESRVAVVTGAAQRLGDAISKRLAGEGSAVILGDIDEEHLAQTAQEIRQAGGSVSRVLDTTGFGHTDFRTYNGFWTHGFPDLQPVGHG